MGNTLRHFIGRRKTAVHPHARGEHFTYSSVFTSNTGSSPRSWGTLLNRINIIFHARFIPTLVGNTRLRPSGTPDPAVHPHARGEHRRKVDKDFPDGGSSPRSWGTQEKTSADMSQSRFIPTLVGNTFYNYWKDLTDAVHPHARGEHLSFSPEGYAILGSSPRSWGTRRTLTCLAVPIRFIPTLVGNTCRVLS